MKMVVTTNWRSNATIAARSLICSVTAIMVAGSSSPQPPTLDYSPTGGHAVLPATFGAWYTSGYNVPSGAVPTPTPTPTPGLTTWWTNPGGDGSMIKLPMQPA
jgi:hypothetical protein